MWTFRATLLIVLAMSFYVVGLVNDLISVYFLTSFAVSSVGLCFLLALFSLSGLSFSFRLESDRVPQGSPLVIRMRIANAARARKGPALVQLRFRNGTLEQSVERTFFFDAVPARESVEVLLSVASLNRGAYECVSLHIQSTDPLGLFRSRLKLNPPLSFLVLPAAWPIETPPGSPYSSGHEFETAGALVSSAGLEFAGTRPFVSGDDSRHIHWPSTARHARLIVRQFHSATRPSTVILVRLADGGVDLPYGELAVRATATLADSALRRGHEVALVAMGRETRSIPFDTGTWQRSRIMDALARLQYPSPGEATAGPATWFRSAEARVVRYLLAAMPSSAALHLITCASDDPMVRYLLLHRRAGAAVSATGLASSTEMRVLLVGPAAARSHPGMEQIRSVETEDEIRAALGTVALGVRRARSA